MQTGKMQTVNIYKPFIVLQFIISVSTVCISESLFLVKLMVSESRNMLINGREESESISKGISKLASHDFGSACHCAKYNLVRLSIAKASTWFVILFSKKIFKKDSVSNCKIFIKPWARKIKVSVDHSPPLKVSAASLSI